MLLMTLCIAITLYELSTIEKSTVSVIEEQQPTTLLILSLSEDLNLAISLLNEYLISGDELDIAKFQMTYQKLYVYLNRIKESTKQDSNNISKESIIKLESLLDEIGQHATTLIFLVSNIIENYPGLKIANEKLNPPGLEFIGLVNEILDADDIDASQNEIAKARERLYKIRYTWVQMMNSVRLYFSQRSNEFNLNSGDLQNFDNYSDLNKRTLKNLRDMNLNIGFDALTTLYEKREQYIETMSEVVKIRHSGHWRADMTLMRSKVNPVAKEMRSILMKLVAQQVKATNSSGAALTSSLLQIRTYTSLLLAFALCSGLLLSIMITKSILPPIKKLMEAARHVANGDLNVKVDLKKTRDEIGLLGCSFNAMVDELRLGEKEKQQHTTKLETLNAELEDRVASRTAELKGNEARIRAIYDNVGEGIIVINNQGYIDSINPTAQRIFCIDQKDVIGMHAIFLLADQKYKDLIKSADYNDETQGPFKTRSSKHPVEFEGKRMDGSTFPMEMVVTGMTLGENQMRTCIVRDITRRRQAENRLVDAQKNLLDAAHKSGMAEMATGVLHNIGNILNSVSVSVEEICRIARNSKVKGLVKANSMLSDNVDNIGEFLQNDSKGKKLPEYYLKVGDSINNELNYIIDESRSLNEKTTMMKEVIATQQAYATTSLYTENFQIAPLVEDALKVQEASINQSGIKIIKHVADTPDIKAQKSKLLQVITNLIKNAKEATAENDSLYKHKEIIIEIDTRNEDTVYVSIYDNGCGIDKNNLSNIFNHGFTTKENGHGFGLHTSANSMTEMGGALTVSSDGPELGACFTVSLPVANEIAQKTDKDNHTTDKNIQYLSASKQ